MAKGLLVSQTRACLGWQRVGKRQLLVGAGRFLSFTVFIDSQIRDPSVFHLWLIKLAMT
jgi:hypothetical protein